MQATRTIRLDNLCHPTFLVSPVVEWLHAIDLVVMAEEWGEGFAPWVYATRASLAHDRFEVLAACTLAIRWETVVARIEIESGLANDFEWMTEWIRRLDPSDFLSFLDEEFRGLAGDSASASESAVREHLTRCCAKVADPEPIARHIAELLQEPESFQKTYADTLDGFLETYLRTEWEQNRPPLEEEAAKRRESVLPTSIPALIERLTGRSITLSPDFNGEYNRVLATPTMLLGPFITLSLLPGDERRLLLIYGIRPDRSPGDSMQGTSARSASGFKALGEETRYRILQLLASGEMYAHEIGLSFPHLGQPAISRHLRTLAVEGILDVRDAQAKKYYSLNRSRIRVLEAELSRLTKPASGPGKPTPEGDAE